MYYLDIRYWKNGQIHGDMGHEIDETATPDLAEAKQWARELAGEQTGADGVAIVDIIDNPASSGQPVYCIIGCSEERARGMGLEGDEYLSELCK